MLTALFVTNPLAANAEANDITAQKERAECAVVLMNHLNWVVARVEQDTKNAAILEEEYENLTDNNINIATIEDMETAQEIITLMGVFTDMRKCIMDIDVLHDCAELRKKAAIYRAIPNPGALLVSGGNPIASAALLSLRLAEVAATSYMNNKTAEFEMLVDYKKERNEIEKRRLSALNAINEELFWRQWQLVQKYNLNDAWRTARIDCRELAAIISIAEEGDSTPALVRSYLVRNEKRFSYLPIYWYYRAVFALGNAAEVADEEKEDALYACSQFEERHKEIVRKDRIFANVAMMSIGARGEKIEPKERERLLQVILDNMKTHDWDLAYFVAQQYAAYGEMEKAKNVIGGMVDNLEALFFKYQQSQRKFDIVSMKDLEPKQAKDSVSEIPRYASFPSDGLFLCRLLYAHLLENLDGDQARDYVSAKLKPGCAANMSLIEKVEYAMMLGKVSGKLDADLRRIAITKQKGGFSIGRFEPWMISERGKVRATVRAWNKTDTDNDKGRDLSPDYVQSNPGGNHYTPSGDVECRIGDSEFDKLRKIELTLWYGKRQGEGTSVRFVFKGPLEDITSPSEVWYGDRQLIPAKK